jgi:TonB-dependent SusC/RagA subfamily outer membrane receptor
MLVCFFSFKITLLITYEMKKSSVLITMIFFAANLFCVNVSAQDKTLVGKVTTFDSIPLTGVTVQVKSTGQIVQTDTLGLFQVMCNPEDKIEVEANGFYSKKIKVEKEIRLMLINLTLKKGDKNLEQAERYVDVGYGQVNTKKLLNAVSSLNSKDTDFSVYSNMLDLIQGQFPGVSVQGGVIIVRGTTTLYGGEQSAALIVIDGSISNYQDLANLSPLDVASVDVLKDGSSSVYGSRGANGVVIVQTKKGN